ncbi:MAG: DNA cytosine methyltransferase [Aquabacterium sp.]|uniref:DNA cytosine methyltransferase n=1 Tax=Aquabacterium sp. TaxID=1872578 RepID=UPI0025C42C7A|nr:DNA cytosine methyltransferase [Aquabacterium sp.]MBI5926479.1 DNA cytosine methyltransferase [Aquabacterium sp.]
MANQLEFISLFSGAGGLDLGFEAAGWECLYASDIDVCAVETLKVNQGKWVGGQQVLGQTVIEQADVAALSGSEILRKIDRRKGEVPLLVGGPPCQSWSSAGNQLGFEDPRGQLFKDYVRIASETGVRWLVFENVRGLLTARGPDGQPGSALEHIRKVLLDAGFQTEVELCNAADFGVPQRRVRLILIGFRAGDRPSFPKATHSKSLDLVGGELQPWNTLGGCLAGLEPLAHDEVIRANPSLHAQLSVLQPGSGVKSPGKKETTRPGGHWGYKQGAFVADLALPARTVTASGQQDWVKDPKLGLRRLSPRECAAIQTFPCNWEFVGKRSDQYRLIGNAVPAGLAYAIACELKRSVEAGAKRLKDPALTSQLIPLRPHLQSAIHYTRKEEIRNGDSRRVAPIKRRSRVAAMQ